MSRFKIKIDDYSLMTRCSMEESVKKEDKKNELFFFATITKIKSVSIVTNEKKLLQTRKDVYVCT